MPASRERLCPRCRIPMTPTALGAVTIDECPTCHSAWFDDQELRQATDHADRDLAWLDVDLWRHPERFTLGAQQWPCPADGATLVDVHYPPTSVTVCCCPTCHGVWLQKDQFRQIIGALEEELNELSSSDYLKASVHEAKDLFSGHESFPSEWRDLRSLLHLLRLRFFVEHPKLTQTLERLPRLTG